MSHRTMARVLRSHVLVCALASAGLASVLLASRGLADEPGTGREDQGLRLLSLVGTTELSAGDASGASPGGAPKLGVAFDVALDVLVVDGTPERERLVVQRQLTPRAGGFGPGGATSLEWIEVHRGRDPDRTEIRRLGVGLPAWLESYLPLDVALSLCRSSVGGENGTSRPLDAVVSVAPDDLTLGGREARFERVKRRVESRGLARCESRAAILPVGGITLEDGRLVLAWEERIEHEASRSRLSFARESRTGGARPALESLRLEAKQDRTARGIEAGSLRAVLPTLRDAIETLGTRSGTGSRLFWRTREIARSAAGASLEPWLVGLRALRRERFAVRAPQETAAAVKIGEAAPDFVTATLDGDLVSLRELIEGRVAYLTFWGLGCAVCLQEAPHLSRLQAAYRDQGVLVVAVNAWEDGRDAVAELARRAGLEQELLLDGRAAAKQLYRVRAYPTGFWIDHTGIVRERVEGFGTERAVELERSVDALLEESRSKSAQDSRGESAQRESTQGKTQESSRTSK